MIIGKQKLFSTGDSELDGILEEVYYSGISDGYDYAQKEFGKVWDVEEDEGATSTKEERKQRSEKRKGDRLDNSHRGLGRSLILGGGLPGAIGAYTTKDDVDKDYDEGYSEDEIIKRSGKRGAKRGALIGGGTGLASGIASAALSNKVGKALGVKANPLALAGTAALSTATGAGWGALGAHLGAKKNAKKRLEKTKARRYKED